MRRRNYWTDAADAEVSEKEYVIKRTSGIFASRQFPESTIPQDALYDSQDIIPGTLRVRRGSGATDLGNAYWKPSITNTPKITGLFSFRRHSGTSELIAAIGGGVYKAPGDVFTKLSNPTALPAGGGLATAFSTDGVYLAVAHSAAPYVTIYKRSGDTFTKLADPATLPTGTGRGAAFSTDGTYLAIAHSAAPYVTIYKRSGDVFTKLSNPTALPAGLGLATTFSADGTYLAVAHDIAPYVTIYKRSGDVFTKLSNPTALPAGLGRGTTFSADGTYLAVAHDIAPYVTIYKRSGDTFTKLADPATLPVGAGYGTAFSTDGTYLAVAHFTSPYVTIYKRSGDVFTKLADPAALPAGLGSGAAFSTDGTYLAIAHFTSPYVTIYKRSGDTFTKLADPAALPAGGGYGTAFSTDGTYLAVAQSAAPYVTIYKRSAGVSSTTLETGLTNNNFEFATMNDVLYYVNGDNGLRQYNGTTAAAVTAYTPDTGEPANYLSDSGNDIHNSRYITVHDGVMYLASPPGQPYRLYRCDEVRGVSYWHHKVDVISENGGEIRWIKSFAGVLVVFKSDSIWAIDGLVGSGDFRMWRLHNSIGCAAGRTVQEIPGLGLVFMGSDLHFYVLKPDYVNGENVPLFRLSGHISDLISTLLTSDPASSSGIEGNLYVCSVNLLGNDIQKRTLAFDFTRVESVPSDPTSLFVPWGLFKEDASTVFARHFDNALEHLFGASEMGIFYFEYPNDTNLIDDAFFEFYNLDFEEPHINKFQSDIHVVTNYENRSRTVQPAVSVDDGDYSDLDTLSSYSVDGVRLPKRFGLTSTDKKVGTFKLPVNQSGYRFRYKFVIQDDDYGREFSEIRFRYVPDFYQ